MMYNSHSRSRSRSRSRGRGRGRGRSRSHSHSHNVYLPIIIGILLQDESHTGMLFKAESNIRIGLHFQKYMDEYIIDSNRKWCI